MNFGFLNMMAGFRSLHLLRNMNSSSMVQPIKPYYQSKEYTTLIFREKSSEFKGALIHSTIYNLFLGIITQSPEFIKLSFQTGSVELMEGMLVPSKKRWYYKNWRKIQNSSSIPYNNNHYQYPWRLTHQFWAHGPKCSISINTKFSLIEFIMKRNPNNILCSISENYAIMLMTNRS